VPPRNIRQFVELLFERQDFDVAAKILSNYSNCLEAKDVEPRRKTALGLAQLPTVRYRAARCDDERYYLNGESAGERRRSGNPKPSKRRLRSLGQEACSNKKYKSIAALCASFEKITAQRPGLGVDLRSRIGVENRLPEMIEEAINADQISAELVDVLRQLPKNSVEHLADRFFRAQSVKSATASSSW